MACPPVFPAYYAVIGRNLLNLVGGTSLIRSRAGFNWWEA